MTEENTPVPSNSPERIAKVIARSGVASRRDAEKMILEGRVSVNGKKIASPALDVRPADRVTIDGRAIDAPQETRVWLYYKPLGLITSEKDEQGRRTIFDEMPEGMPRVLNVGRLDLNSEGLLLLTNDGGLKRRLELPETGWLRKYRVRVNGRPDNSAFDPLRAGITIDGENFQPMEIDLDRQQGANAWLTVGIREGKNREIRRAMNEIGLMVNRLIRVSYGPFRLNEMEPGAVVEIKRKVLRDQLGDRLLYGVEEGRASFAEREAASAVAKTERLADRDARREGGKPFERREGGKPFERREGGKPFERKSEGFRSHRDDDKPRGSFGDKPRTYGDKPREGGYGDKPRGSFGDKPRGSFGEKPSGFKSHGAKTHGGPAGGGRAGGFKSHGAKPAGDRPAGKSFGKPAGKPFGKPSGGPRKPY